MLGKPELETFLFSVGPGQTLVVRMDDEDVELWVPRMLVGGKRGGQRQASGSEKIPPRQLHRPDDGQGKGSHQRPDKTVLPRLLKLTPPHHVFIGAYG